MRISPFRSLSVIVPSSSTLGPSESWTGEPGTDGWFRPTHGRPTRKKRACGGGPWWSFAGEHFHCAGGRFRRVSNFSIIQDSRLSKIFRGSGLF